MECHITYEVIWLLARSGCGSIQGDYMPKSYVISSAGLSNSAVERTRFARDATTILFLFIRGRLPISNAATTAPLDKMLLG
jgi:hypothetical protein